MNFAFKRLRPNSSPVPATPLSNADLVLLSEPESEKAIRLRCIARDLLTAIGSLSCVTMVPTRGVDPTLLIANLAYALGEMHHKTAVIEADLRTPKATDIFGLSPNALGLADMLDARLAEVAGLYVINPWLSIVPAGRALSDVTGLLSSPKMHEVIKSISEEHSLTIVYSPAAEDYLDHTFLIPSCEGVVVVVRKDKTRMAEVVALRQQIERLRVPLVYALMDTSGSGWR